MARKQETDTIDVTIHNATYTLRGGSDPSAVRALAQDLDARMKALASKAPAADPLKVAILCALRLSDEAREAREILEAAEQDLSSRIEACAVRIDRLLAVAEPVADADQARVPARSGGERGKSAGDRGRDGTRANPARAHRPAPAPNA